MAENQAQSTRSNKKIVVIPGGPYEVHGGIPLVRKSQVVTEFGEPITWKKAETLEAGETYRLCRCGHSLNKPFCDDSHLNHPSLGKESAVTRPSIERRIQLGNGKNIIVRRDYALCIESGFCGNRFTNLEEMASHTDDPNVMAAVIGMVQLCPSGSYTYALEDNGPDIEPDLPEQIAVLTEMTDSGPIMSALWVTGNIPVERADGKGFETRNRVTLCRCGESKAKPLCDGRHRVKLIRE